MLKIGQEVYIRHEPYDGEEYYEFNGNDCARISGLVAYGEEVLYQLDRYPDDCLWCGDDLDATGHNYCTDEPLFDVHDGDIRPIAVGHTNNHRTELHRRRPGTLSVRRR